MSNIWLQNLIFTETSKMELTEKCWNLPNKDGVGDFLSLWVLSCCSPRLKGCMIATQECLQHLQGRNTPGICPILSSPRKLGVYFALLTLFAGLLNFQFSFKIKWLSHYYFIWETKSNTKTGFYFWTIVKLFTGARKILDLWKIPGLG